jgi:hypothetical protein
VGSAAMGSWLSSGRKRSAERWNRRNGQNLPEGTESTAGVAGSDGEVTSEAVCRERVVSDEAEAEKEKSKRTNRGNQRSCCRGRRRPGRSHPGKYPRSDQRGWCSNRCRSWRLEEPRSASKGKEEGKEKKNAPKVHAAPAIPQKNAPVSVSSWQSMVPVGASPSPWLPY